MAIAPLEAGAPAPRITVIMATYNWSTVLPYSIESVLRQSFEDFELLVVGDHCTDDSAEVVASIAERDGRVRWINLPENAGNQFGPNNEGLRQAQAPLVAYLGHDDLWLPHHLALLVEALEGGASLAHTLAAGVVREGRPPHLMPVQESGSIPPSIVGHRKEVAEQLGGWRDFRLLPPSLYPDRDLWDRARKAGYAFTPVERLTVIKLIGETRTGQYRDKPFYEQAAWTLRVQQEEDLEAVLLGEIARVLNLEVQLSRNRVPLWRRVARAAKKRLLPAAQAGEAHNAVRKRERLGLP